MREEKSIFITGASSGIGRACALHLDGLGNKVFAGVRTAQAAEDLRRHSAGRIVPKHLDVTNAEDIETAVKSIEAETEGGGLDGLVNSVETFVVGPLGLLPLDDLRRAFEVNVIGPVAITQACLPLLRRANGRLVNLGSASGRFAMPFTGPYDASKSAIEALTTSLRRELKPYDLHVALVEPGVVEGDERPAIEDRIDELVKRLDGHDVEPFRRSLETARREEREGWASGSTALEVAKAVTHALMSRKPRVHYLVGRDARLAAMASFLPSRVADAMAGGSKK